MITRSYRRAARRQFHTFRGTVLITAAASLSLAAGLSVPATGASAATGTTKAASHLTLPSYKEASQSPDWVATPNGLVYRSCVHQVPNGGTVDADGNIVVDNIVHSVPACPYAGPVRPDHSAVSSTSSALTPPGDGWWEASWWNHNWLSGVSADWIVPSNPSANGALVYFFPSLEGSSSGSSPFSAIIQPVLQWGGNGSFGGNYWTIASWYVYNNNNNSYISQHASVSAGDLIDGYMSIGGCDSDGSHCHESINTVDSTDDAQLNVITPEIWGSAQGGVLEAYGVSSCNMLPASGEIEFSGVTVQGENYTNITPSFSMSQFSGAACSVGGFAGSHDYTSGTIYYTDIWWTT